MRPIHALFGLAVVLASGASAYVATRLASEPSAPATEPVGIPAAPLLVDEAAAQRARANEDKVAMLMARLDAVSDELETLRSSAMREPVAAPTSVMQGDTISGSASVTEEQRRTVLAVLAEEKAREAAEAELRRQQAEQQQADRRAGRIAKDLSLSPGDEAVLAGLMLQNTRKGREMFEGLRNDGDRENARAMFEAFNAERKDQYTQAFGAALAEQILQAEGGPGFGGDRMMGVGGEQRLNGGGRGGRRGTGGNPGGAGGAQGGSGGIGGGSPPGGGGGQQQQ